MKKKFKVLEESRFLKTQEMQHVMGGDNGTPLPITCPDDKLFVQEEVCPLHKPMPGCPSNYTICGVSDGYNNSCAIGTIYLG